jgi:hypothetical protein
MKHYNNIEVILLSNHSATGSSQKELINWLTTILQPTIDKQQESRRITNCSSLPVKHSIISLLSSILSIAHVPFVPIDCTTVLMIFITLSVVFV